MIELNDKKALNLIFGSGNCEGVSVKLNDGDLVLCIGIMK